MPITISGSGTITGLTTGGLPDGSIAAADIAAGVIPAAFSLSNAEDGTGTNFEFNSGFGSNGVAYGCRAWVNFNGGASPLSIRGSGNVSSVTDHGAGDYSVNFATSMPDANYSSGGWVMNGTYAFRVLYGASAAFPSTSAIRIGTANNNLAAADSDTVHFQVFR